MSLSPSVRPLVPALLGLFVGSPAGAAVEGVIGPNILIEAHPATKAQFVELRDSVLDVVHIHGNTFDIVVDDAQLSDLQARGIPLQVVDPDVSKNLRALKLGRAPGLGAYTTYSEMVTRLNARVASYPAIASKVAIGTTGEGRTIWALKISDNVAVDEDEPEILYYGNHHARELITVEIPLALADSLLMNYGTSTRYTNYVDTREIWIVPILNPDGYVYVENVNTNWRKNRRNNGDGNFGVDLNRNYAYNWGYDNNGSSGFTGSETYRGPSAASEPEIQAIQNFVNAHSFVFSISYHSYGRLWLWGPGYKPTYGPEHDVFNGYGSRAAAFNGYLAGTPGTGAIYLTNGGSDDWLYNSPTHSKVYAMTPECGTQFYPPESEIPTLVAENIEPAWIALDFADRPSRLAPPGPPALLALPTDTDGDYDLNWTAPTVGDTQPVSYEVVEKTGPSVVTEGFEVSAATVNTGGFVRSTARKYAGSWSLYSGSADGLNRICLTKEAYLVQPGDSFTFRAWYSIEGDWDYAYVILSTDGGRTFASLPGTNTTMTNPNGNNADNGITGSSGGWIAMTFNLSAYVGQRVRLGFRYFTDGGVSNEGLYVDNVALVQTYASTTTLNPAVLGTTLNVTGRADGDYYYAVRGKDAENEVGWWSNDLKVTVEHATDAPVVAPAAAFQLSAPVPTPFGTRTTVSFRLPVASEHSLSVFDVTGRRVRTLSQGVRPAGAQSVEWDGRDDEGRTVPAGIYFLELRSPAGELRQRTVRLR